MNVLSFRRPLEFVKSHKALFIGLWLSLLLVPTFLTPQIQQFITYPTLLLGSLVEIALWVAYWQQTKRQFKSLITSIYRNRKPIILISMLVAVILIFSNPQRPINYLVLVLIGAVAIHEIAHFAILSLGHANPQSALRKPSKRLIMSLGLGWCYNSADASLQVRLTQFAVANLVEICFWCAAAIFLPDAALLFVGMGAIMLTANWYIEKSDGWNYRHLVNLKSQQMKFSF